MDLKGKIAVVTGVSKGIGKATVQALLEEGMTVVGWGRSEPSIVNDQFHFIKADVGDAQQVQSAHVKTVSLVGDEISVLINNAGVGYEGFVDQLSDENWRRMFMTNVDATFFATKAVIGGMKERKEGHIINISSIAGNTGIPGMSGYCATKFAVRGFSQALYKEVRNFGVKVTCIYPGAVNTNFFDDIDSVTADDKMMRPEDIAQTIVQCLSSHANYHHVDIEVRPMM